MSRFILYKQVQGPRNVLDETTHFNIFWLLLDRYIFVKSWDTFVIMRHFKILFSKTRAFCIDLPKDFELVKKQIQTYMRSCQDSTTLAIKTSQGLWMSANSIFPFQFQIVFWWVFEEIFTAIQGNSTASSGMICKNINKYGIMIKKLS